MASNEDILSADKLLFAVDLVDHVIVKTRPSFAYKTLNILERVDRLRNYTYNRFDKDVKRAIDVIDVNEDKSVHRDFCKMVQHRRVDRETFTEYAESYRLNYLRDGFQGKYFLKYCHHVANMAGYFLSYGADEAPEYAVDLIMKAFPEGAMYSGTWMKVHLSARSYVRIGSGYLGERTSSESSGESTGLPSETEENGSSRMEGVQGSSREMESENLRKSSKNLGEFSNVLGSGSCFEMQDVLSSQSSDYSAETPSSPIIEYSEDGSNEFPK